MSVERESEGTPTRESILKLMKNRKNIDEDIEALGGILAHNHVTMTDPLTDAEGFPRNDIDVYQVRIARHQIICLQNDRKNLTNEIENALALFHARAAQDGTQTDAMETDSTPQTGLDLSPIAIVNLVSEGSPAFQAGIRLNDQLISVGSINSMNFTSLADIGHLVDRCKGNVVSVRVMRGGTVVKLALIPGPWAGKGLIGCQIIPIESLER